MKRLCESTYRIKSIHKRLVVHFDRLIKCAGVMRLQSEKCPSEPSTADSDTPPAPNHHPAERMEIVKDMDDPGPGEHLQEISQWTCQQGTKRNNYSIMKCMHLEGIPSESENPQIDIEVMS